MKLIKIIVVLSLLIIVGIGVLIFTPQGNDFVKPHLSTFSSKYLDKNITFNKLSIKLDEIVLDISINNVNKFNLSGKYDILKHSFDLQYSLLSTDVSSLNNTLNGEFSTNGKILGDVYEFKVNGNSLFANGETNYNVIVENFKVLNIIGESKGLELIKLTEFVNQKNYINGNLDLSFNINDLKTLSGKINTNVEKATLNTSMINEDFKQELPKNFILDIKTESILDNFKINTTGNIASELFNIEIQESNFDIKNNELNSKNILKINDLSKLKFITKQILNGEFESIINVNFINNKLDVNLLSDFLGGNIDIKMIDSNLKTNIKNIKVEDSLKLLNYPIVYDGLANGNVDLDIVNQNGEFNIDINNGHILNNDLIPLINKFLNIDITKENFTKALIVGTIKRNIVEYNLNLISDNFNISSKQSVIDNLNKTIDMVLNIKYKNYDFNINVSGNINKPKIYSKSIETLLKNKFEDKIGDKIYKSIDDKAGIEIGESLNEKTKNLLKNLIRF